MALYSVDTAGETDHLSDSGSEDDFETPGDSPRCLVLCRKTCRGLTKTRPRKIACSVVIIVILLVLAAASTALGLYMNGFFIPTCQRKFSFDLYFDIGPPYQSPIEEPVSFKYSWDACNNSIVKDNALHTPLDGLYFLGLSAGLESFRKLSYSVIDKQGTVVARVNRNSTFHSSSDTISKDTVCQLTKGQQLYAVRAGKIYDNEDYLLTSWSGFRMTELFSPLHVFGYRRSAPQNDTGAVLFDVAVASSSVRGAELYNSSTGVFTASAAGVYFFTFTTGVPAGETQNVTLDVNGKPAVTLYRNSNVTNGTDVLSRSALVKLADGEEVSLQLRRGKLYSSEQGQEATFSGFLYEPAGSSPAHCWSVYLDHSWTSADNGSLDPVPFKNVVVNGGQLFNPENSTVTIKVAGTYYVYVSLGLQPFEKGYVHILHNGKCAGSVARFVGYHNGDDQIGRSALVHARAGDTLHVWGDACPDCAILSDPINQQTTFIGFLVHEELD